MRYVRHKTRNSKKGEMKLYLLCSLKQNVQA